jgi:alkylation response protein AidB-like acyl-CoA dehydrogenase
MVIDPPMTLSALAGSRTTAVHFNQVLLPADEVLIPPMEQVLGKSGGGGLETSCLAIGLARAALDLLRPEAALRVEIAKTLQTLDPQLSQLRTRLHQAAGNPAERDGILELRADCTLFVLRTTQLALLLIKGAGFVKPHPIQRLVQQALFFLVWSCPRPANEKIWKTLLD